MRKYLRNITVGAALLLLAGNLRSIIRINIKFMMQTLRL